MPIKFLEGLFNFCDLFIHLIKLAFDKLEIKLGVLFLNFKEIEEGQALCFKFELNESLMNLLTCLLVIELHLIMHHQVMQLPSKTVNFAPDDEKVDKEHN